jgi:hypothetical protein
MNDVFAMLSHVRRIIRGSYELDLMLVSLRWSTQRLVENLTSDFGFTVLRVCGRQVIRDSLVGLHHLMDVSEGVGCSRVVRLSGFLSTTLSPIVKILRAAHLLIARSRRLGVEPMFVMTHDVSHAIGLFSHVMDVNLPILVEKVLELLMVHGCDVR